MKQYLLPLRAVQPFALWLAQADRSILLDHFASEAAVNRHINAHLAPIGAAYHKRAGAVVPGRLAHTQYNVGRCRYLLSYHDGVSTHRDGSPFFGCHIESNRRDYQARVNQLLGQGYTFTN